MKVLSAVSELVQTAFRQFGGEGGAEPVILRGKSMKTQPSDLDTDQTTIHTHVPGIECHACRRTAAAVSETGQRLSGAIIREPDRGENADVAGSNGKKADAGRPSGRGKFGGNDAFILQHVSPAILQQRMLNLTKERDDAIKVAATYKRRVEGFEKITREFAEKIDSLQVELAAITKPEPHEKAA